MARKTTTRASGATADPFKFTDPFDLPAVNPLLVLARFQAKAFKTALQWQIEALDFYKHRYERDIRFVDDLMNTTEPGETISTCSSFFQDALDDYSQEAVKAASYGSRAAIDTAEEIRHEAETLSSEIKSAAA